MTFINIVNCDGSEQALILVPYREVSFPFQDRFVFADKGMNHQIIKQHPSYLMYAKFRHKAVG